ncbi:acetate/propionate family kinase [Polaromonas sp.]|uniref:acetate/propionate family kinase n=1 Tax=Polaromonas sp. TaxID=1869339 RepID=UPI003264A694
MNVLTLNAGSSSIKFALFRRNPVLRCMLRGQVERIGQPDTAINVEAPHASAGDGQIHARHPIPGDSFNTAAAELLMWLEAQPEFGRVAGVGHRVVHGMQHSQPEPVGEALLDELRGLKAVDPDHLPGEIRLIELMRQRHPRAVQVACFDTAFHHDMPRVAQLLPIPRRYEALGLRRYGFHGLSYGYLMEELASTAGADAANRRVVLAHLGSGASLAAVHAGHCIDTSMAFTPTAGLPMATRSGDLDPGIAAHLARTEGMTAQRFYDLANHESGLLGISETSGDMRDLLAAETTDTRAAEAVSYFCYQVKKWIGAYAAALGGVDTLVFAGGIGEHAAPVRQRICEGLGFLGIELDPQRNVVNAALISAGGSRVDVRVVHTDEELVIARAVSRELTRGAGDIPSEPRP